MSNDYHPTKKLSFKINDDVELTIKSSLLIEKIEYQNGTVYVFNQNIGTFGKVLSQYSNSGKQFFVWYNNVKNAATQLQKKLGDLKDEQEEKLEKYLVGV